MNKPIGSGISRRGLIRLGLITAAACVVPYKALASVEDILSTERKLCFYNLHTEENLEAVYWKDGKYVPQALTSINHIFRDHYTGAVRPIDQKLIDLLFEIKITLDDDEPFQIISAYRTPKTNAYLRRHQKGVARNSLHMQGKAVDIRLPDRRLIDLRRAAFKMKAGGVGYYVKSNFVHIDVGRVRYW
ncbi:MAG TPA: DUF882 domain-containing protein [Nitrospirae bacterium]|nr:DUF882 domain-containing protein [Nitrospirota bacterium]HDK81054.1 DUF882 domain-containing protein [Nitrospirota bacterium]HDO25419.1 DUF882 domain-containing protein [Nitrospirota bacterium]